MNQHVHNSRYLDYVLAARYDQMTRCYQMPMSDFLARGFTWYVKTAHIEHKRGLVIGDSITVRTRVSEMRRHGVQVEFEIIKQRDNKLSAKGYFDYVMVDAETGRPVVIPPDIAAAYSV